MGVGANRIERNGAWLASHTEAAVGIAQIPAVVFQIEAVVAAFGHPLTVTGSAGQRQYAVLAAKIAAVGSKSINRSVGFHGEQSRFRRLDADADGIVYGGGSSFQSASRCAERERCPRFVIVYHNLFAVVR